MVKSMEKGTITKCTDLLGNTAQGKIINIYDNTVSWERLSDGSTHIGLKRDFGLETKGQSWAVIHDGVNNHFDIDAVRRRGKLSPPIGDLNVKGDS